MKNINWNKSFVYGALAAGAFSIPLFAFIRLVDYSNSWLLFLGNFLFLFAVLLFLANFSKTRKAGLPLSSMIVAGEITTAIGVVLSVLACLCGLALFGAGLFNHANSAEVLHSAPTNIVKGKSAGLGFMVFMSAIIGNFVARSFVCVVVPFVLREKSSGV